MKVTKSDSNVIGKRIRQFRLARGMSLRSLSAQIGGQVSAQMIWKYEQGRSVPRNVIINEIAHVLGVKSVQLWSEPKIRIEFFWHGKAM